MKYFIVSNNYYINYVKKYIILIFLFLVTPDFKQTIGLRLYGDLSLILKIDLI